MKINQIPGVEIRSANLGDIDFVAKIIIQAVKGGTDVFLYDRVFGISETEFKDILKDILKTGIPGSEFSLSEYILFTYNKTPIMGFALWEEGKTGKSSDMIKGMLLSHFIGIERWKMSLEILVEISKLDKSREKGMVILDAVYLDKIALQNFTIKAEDKIISKSFGSPIISGYHIAKQLINFKCKNLIFENPSLTSVRTLTFRKNIIAQKFFTKLGFHEYTSVKSNSPTINNFLPDNELVYLQTNINNLLNG